ncbi:MAG: hypothetical protein ACRDIB_15305, partial [Ardenticatenaceae bacterium]
MGDIQHSGELVGVLTKRLTDPDSARQVNERLAELGSRLERSEEQLEEMASQVKKLSRTQFKANTLAETQEQTVAKALATLQEIVTRREEAQQERSLRDQRREKELQAEARGELAMNLLPVLDGIEAALDKGRSLLARRQRLWQEAQTRVERAATSSTRPGLWERLSYALAGEIPAPSSQAGSTSSVPNTESDKALAAWLEGLDLVRERFESLLAAEGIHPIMALGESFD